MTWNRTWDRLGGVLSGASVFLGLLVLIGFLTGLVISLSVVDIDYRRVVFTNEGEPRIQQYDYDESGGQVIEWLDVNLESVARYMEHADVPALGVAGIGPAYGYWQSAFVSPVRAWYRGDPRRSRAFWYILPKEGRIVGFAHPEAKRLAAYGPEGRISDESDALFAAPFQASDTQWSGASTQGYPFDHLLADGATVFGFSTNPPHMFKIWRSEGGEVDGLGLVTQWPKPIEVGQIFVRAGNRLTVLDKDGNPLGAVDLPNPLHGLDRYFTAGYTGEKIVLSRRMGTNRVHAYAFGRNGELLNEWDIKLRELPPLAWWESPIPLSFCLSASPSVASAFLLGRQYWDPYDSIPIPVPCWPLLVLSAGITFVSVLLTWRHLQHRASRAKVMGWMVLVALLSWPGLLVCLCTVRLSKRIACPACDRPRALEVETCPHCQGSWPAPETTGLEILRPAVI